MTTPADSGGRARREADPAPAAGPPDGPGETVAGPVGPPDGPGEPPTGPGETVAGPAGRRPTGVAPARLKLRWVVLGVVAVLVALLAGLALGPVRISAWGIAKELLDLIPGVHLHSGLTEREAAIVTQLRLPRVVLGLLVGATLALAGGCYQGVFGNPLADPYTLGVAAGAGLGATVAIAARKAFAALPAAGGTGTPLSVPFFAFVGALAAVGMTYALGAAGGRYRSKVTLVLAGVAVAAFFTAGQSYLQQKYVETIREVYSWIMGRLTTAGWHDVLLMLPFAVFAGAVILLQRRQLDVMSVGDEEAESLGAHPKRTRVVLIVAASLATAAAVSVTGLIGFVGIIVPHAVRLVAGTSYRVILPLSVLYGAAFLALADLGARTLSSPDEIPIGVVTAFLGAPFFVVIMRTSKQL